MTSLSTHCQDGMGSEPFKAASNLEAGDKNAPGFKNDEDTRHPSSLTIGAVPDVQRFEPSLLAGEEGDVEPVYVEWEINDPKNPFHFSNLKKWTITLTGCAFTGITASVASVIALGYPSMIRDLNCSAEQAAATLSLYSLGFGVAPLILASLSEEFGRRPMYLVTGAIFTIFFLPIALARNIQTVLIARFVQGAAGSTGATMVGGTMADIWQTHERGLPMSIFALSALLATGLGPVVAGWIEMNSKYEWRWIQWIGLIVSGTFTLWMAVYGIKETRGPILLAQRAKHLRKTTGDNRYQTLQPPPKIRDLIWVSCTRPLQLLVTEPVVMSFSLWIGFAWGVLYGLVQSVSLVFRTLYGFNAGENGSVFAAVCVGTLIGFISNFYQTRLYHQNVAKVGPEARLYSACVAGVTLVIGSFVYAWTSYPNVHWVAPCIGITIIVGSIFVIYLAVFNYLADSYLIYASSALAGQSLCRNIFATAFPLFTDQMYTALKFRWASSLLGFVALGLAPIPFILFFWGPTIRAQSGFARKVAQL